MVISETVLLDKYKIIAYLVILIVISIGTVKEKIYKLVIIGVWTAIIIATTDSISGNLVYTLWEHSGGAIEMTIVQIISSSITIFFLLLIIFKYHKTLAYNKISMGYYVVFVVLALANSIALEGLDFIIESDTSYQYKMSAVIIYAVISLGGYLQLFMIVSLALSRNVYREKDEIKQNIEIQNLS